MYTLQHKNSLIVVYAKLSPKCLPTINPILLMKKQKQRSPVMSLKLQGLKVLPLCHLCDSPVNHIHAILYFASLLSYQCFNPPCHKLAQDIGERREDGRRRWWRVVWLAMSCVALFSFASPPAALRDWGASDSFAALGETSMSSVCRCHGLFDVPTYCRSVSLLLQCLWTLFYYVESRERQTAVCGGGGDEAGTGSAVSVVVYYCCQQKRNLILADAACCESIFYR